MAAFFEAAAANQLGSEGPSMPNLTVGNPQSGSVPATFPCVLLKAIGYTESSWTQFCAADGSSGPTIISFDCGYGVTQVTSGMSTGSMGVLSFNPARVASEADYNIGTGAGILAVKWLSTPSIGDNQPTILEDWYYATWAYNGFAYVNNPNNPDFPSGRPPFHSPSGLSRGSYPYQELVWGYIAYPAANLWEPIPVSYPSNAAIGSSPGDIADPPSVHTDPCQGGIVVDDQDPEFTLVQGSEAILEAESGGWEDHFYYQEPYSTAVPYTVATWTPDIPDTALYELDVFVPASGFSTETAASFVIHFLGGQVPRTVNMAPDLGDWVELFPGQPLKFAAGQRGDVTLMNLSSSAPGTWMAWDAIRWRYAGEPGPGGDGDGCTLSNDCEGNLVCQDDVCTSDCVAFGCDAGTCNPATGICEEAPSGDDDTGPDGPPSDTDQDGIPNAIEGPSDADNDGTPNWFDLDSDGDGIPDVVEGFFDTDGDGWPDFLDEDSDGDGISDWTEVGPDGDEPSDSDGDGTPDFQDEDSDDDGVPDAVEDGGNATDPVDSDGDGTPDFQDTDSDNDGIDDATEAGPDPLDPIDTDGDGTADMADTDSDGDGLGDSFEGEEDSDGDSVPDYLDEDSDGDGIPDAEDPDSDGDGLVDRPGVLDTQQDPGGTAGMGCGCAQGGTVMGAWMPAAIVMGWRRRRGSCCVGPGRILAPRR
jgi:hypothetical protein